MGTCTSSHPCASPRGRHGTAGTIPDGPQAARRPPHRYGEWLSFFGPRAGRVAVAPAWQHDPNPNSNANPNPNPNLRGSTMRFSIALLFVFALLRCQRGCLLGDREAPCGVAAPVGMGWTPHGTPHSLQRRLILPRSGFNITRLDGIEVSYRGASALAASAATTALCKASLACSREAWVTAMRGSHTQTHVAIITGQIQAKTRGLPGRFAQRLGAWLLPRWPRRHESGTPRLLADAAWPEDAGHELGP